MVHKKYIKRGNKKFGPYLYENYRDSSGKTRTKYLGIADRDSEQDNWNIQSHIEKAGRSLRGNRKLFAVLGIFIVVVLGIVLYSLLNSGLTGRASLELAPSYAISGNLSGDLTLVLSQGELIPSDSVVKVSLNGQEDSIPLSELMEGVGESGSYYVQNKNLTGQGQGYGIAGEKLSYPDVRFELEIGTGGGNLGGGNEQGNTTETSQENETPAENQSEQQAPDESQSQETPVENPEQTQEQPQEQASQDLSSPITGSVIAEQGSIINGKASKDNPFSYNLNEGETATIVKGSVQVNGKVLDDNIINLEQQNGIASVTTDYSEEEQGYGKDYSGNQTKDITIDLSKFDITAEQGTLTVSLLYNNEELVSTSRAINAENGNLSGNETIENQTIANETIPIENASFGLIQNIPDITIDENKETSVNLNDYFSLADSYSVLETDNISLIVDGSVLEIIPDVNFIGARTSKITAYREIEEINESTNETLIVNETAESNDFNIIVGNETNTTITTIQGRARLGEKVKWTAIVQKPAEENVTVDLPVIADNISVAKLNEGEKQQVDENKVSITGNVALSINTNHNQGFFTRLWRSITGRAIQDESLSENGTDTGNETKQVEISDNATDYQIEYETPAPYAVEENTSSGKNILIVGPDEVHYENITAYTYLDNVPEDAIKLYHISEDEVNTTTVNNETNETENVVQLIETRELVNITYYDTNNGLVDYIEWNVLHLSNESYELEFSILNIHSQPEVGREWNVNFETIGRADLLISASQDENYSNKTTIWTNDEASIQNDTDLLFLGVQCGNETLSYVWENNSALIENYSCNETATESSKVLSEGKHVLKFDFGNITGMAYNNASYNLTYGLVLWYHLDNQSAYGENSTKVYDFSKNGNNATVYNSTWNSTGKFSGDYMFNGSSDYLLVPYVAGLHPTAGVTVAAWVNVRDNTKANQFILDTANNYAADGYSLLIVDSRGRFNVANSTDNQAATSGSGSIAQNSWYFIVGTYNGTIVSMYVNGNLAGSNAFYGNINYGGTDNLKFGSQIKSTSQADRFFNGTMDELRIYNRSLSAQEVKILYLSGIGGNGSEICDTGSADGTGGDCTLNHTYYYSEGETIWVNNLVIADKGSLMNSTANISGTGRGATLNLFLDGNLTIKSGGNITGGNISISAANVNITSGGTIDTTGLGYGGGYGPGNGTGDYGGSYGSYGNLDVYNAAGTIGSPYGSALNPVDFGSGGSSKAGGGIVKINATGVVGVYGNIYSYGVGQSGNGQGLGSGGSIWIIANNITGNGTIAADASSNWCCWGTSDGSGGRIAISAPISSFSGTISAGQSKNDGRIGTILVCDSALSGTDSNPYCANLDLKISITTGGTNINYNYGNLTIESPATYKFDGDPNITNGGNSTSPYGIGKTINADNVTIKSGGTLSAEGMGFAASRGMNYSGPGFINYSLGAAYGGASGPNSMTYGSFLEPTALGTGTIASDGAPERQGGGALKINATYVAVLGTLSANGQEQSGSGQKTGSGGSIWVTCTNFSGSGSITAWGGRNYCCGQGAYGGGGGRIHIQATNLVFSGTISTLNLGQTVPGANGTVVLEFANSISTTGASFPTPVILARNNSYGRIVYNNVNQTINATLASRAGSLISISQNNISVYSQNNSNLNTTAMLWLYNLSYTNPTILRDGAYCTDCVQNSYSGGTLSFNVTTFSQYTTMESGVASCQNLTTPSLTYTLTNNVTSNGTCFNIQADNVVLDCNGYAINYSSDGTLGYGVYSGYNFTTVKNCRIVEGNATTSNKYAINFVSANNGTIQNNTIVTSGTTAHCIYFQSSSNSNTIVSNNITTTTGQGIYLDTSRNNNLTSNIITTTSGRGIELYAGSTSNTITSNIITTTSGYGIYLFSNCNSSNLTSNIITTTSGYGILLESSSNNTLTSNQVNSSSSQSYVVYGTTSAHYNNSIDTSNLAEGKPVLYNYSVNNAVVLNGSSNVYGQVICAYCSNVTYNNVTMAGDGINLFYTSNSTISNSNINTSVGYGIYLYQNSSGNNIIYNNITTSGSSGHGIVLSTYSDYNNVSKNLVTTFGSSGRGIYLSSASFNNVTYNNVSAWSNVSSSAIAMTLDANDNLIDHNTFTANTSIYEATGIRSSNGMQRNVITNNYLTGYEGFYLDDANNNLFMNNSVYAAAKGMWFRYTMSNNTFTNMKIYGSLDYANTGSSSYFFIMGDSILNGTLTLESLFGYINLTNVTRANGDNISVSWGGNTGTLNMLWYLDANVISSNLPVQNANVSAYDKNGLSYGSSLTGSNGQLGSSRFTVLQYKNENNTLITYYTPYTLNVSKYAFVTATNSSVNFTNNIIVPMNLSYYSTVPSVTLNSPANASYFNANNFIGNASASSTALNVSIVPNFDGSLVSWWRMDDTNSSGGVVDYMGRNNGTASGGASQTANGKLGKAWSFDGSSGYINTGNDNSLNLTGNITLSAWIYLNSNSSNMDIATKAASQKGYGMGIITGKFACDISTSSKSWNWCNSTATTLQLNTWYHVAFTFNSQTGIVEYVNGKQDGIDSSYTGNINSSTGVLYIGTQNVGYQSFNGTIDDVMIFNRSLSAAEVAALYANSSSQYFSQNYTGLADGSHTFKAYTQDEAGNVNYTDTRQVFTDTSFPTINFTGSTPANGTSQSNRNVFVNVSSSDSAGQHSTFLNWNNSLVLWMRMDDLNSSGGVVDYMGVNNGSVAWGTSSQTTAGKMGKAWSFDGSTGIDAGNRVSLNLSNIGTISAWVKTLTATEAIVTKGDSNSQRNGYRLGILNSQMSFGLYNSTAGSSFSGGGNISDSVWHLVSAVWNGTNVSLYVDGANVNSSSQTIIPNSDVYNLRIGLNPTSGYSWFNGTIDDVMIFNRALTSSEIQSLYNATAYQYAQNYTGLVDGNYTYKAYTQDLAGNVNSTEQRTSVVYLNAGISIITQSVANTTDTINVQGLMKGVDNVSAASRLFTIKLNNVTVSSDNYNFTSFSTGAGTNVNRSTGNLRLNLTSASSILSYSDDYSTQKYITDAYSYSSIGYYAPSGIIFEVDNMINSIGNVTYHYTSPTLFYNATVYATTQSNPIYPGGNTSLYYSLDNSTWTILNSSIVSGVNMTGIVPVNGKQEFYVMLKSNTAGNKENPVTNYQLNYTNYQYSSSGNYTTPEIYLPNVTFTVLRWGQTLNNETVIMQLRQSNDNSTWSAWSSNYTSNLDNDISSYSQPYLQLQAWLGIDNLNVTPVVNSITIFYFNASTNSTGGYNYNITIPTNALGILPLEVALGSSNTGVIGSNTTNLSVYAKTYLPYSIVKNYNGSLANYSVNANFTRIDLGSLVNGTINITIYNSTTILSQACNSSRCTASWLVPANLANGNYTINITGSNEAAYYRNSSASYADYLEEKNTTGTLASYNRTISDFHSGQEYITYVNATIDNTGKAGMNGIHVWAAAYASAIKNITEIGPCSKLYPGQECNASMMVVVDGGAVPGSHFMTFRANWTDNDGNIVSGAGYIQSASRYIIILSNASMAVTNISVLKTIQHNSTGNFVFGIDATGTEEVDNLNISFLSQNITSDNAIPSSWIAFSNNTLDYIPAGQERNITVNISVPVQTTPGNYSGIVNVTAQNVEVSIPINLTIIVPVNATWYILQGNFTYNNSFSLNSAGEIGNFTIVNTGNINLTFNLNYFPSGTKDFTLYPGLFTTDSSGRNPSTLNVSKGGNTSFTAWQNGWNQPLADVGIIITAANESANPVNSSVKDSFTIAEQPPVITNIYFSNDNFATANTTNVEQNKNLSIKVAATEDVNLNLTKTKINISYSGGQTQISASSTGEYQKNGANYIVMNYTSSYIPTTAETYTISAIVYDASGNLIVSKNYNFTSYGTTALTLGENASSISLAGVDLNHKGTFYVNYTLSNIGIVTAYSANLSFSSSSYLETAIASFGNISSGANTSQVVQINATKLTPAGNYTVTGTLTWKNPNNIYSSTSINFTVNVLTNKSFVFSPTTPSYTISSGSSNSSALKINNTGNANLTAMNLNCYTGSLCSAFTLGFNESSFTIAVNSSRNINISISAPAGTEAGDYNGMINISESSISNAFEIQATVPQTLTWTISPDSINKTEAALSSGVVQEVQIYNTGNVNMTFSLDSTDSSLIQPNESSITVPLGQTRNFKINYYSTPEGDYLAKINITNNNPSAQPLQANVSVNLTFTAVTLSVLSPTSASPLTNIKAGDTILLTANATYGGKTITNSSAFSAEVNNVSCSNISYNYIASSGYWSISCIAPALTDGKTYNLTLTLIHDIYGGLSSDSNNSIAYKDTTPPFFSITRNSVNLGGKINLTANATDNVGIDSVKAYVTYPDSSVVNYTLSLSNGLYINNTATLNIAGEYIVNYTANDSSGNANSSADWFEVHDDYLWSTKITGYNSAPVQDVNISFLRPNSTTILLNNVTGTAGGASFSVNKRNYDIFVRLSGDTLTIANVNFTNASASNLVLNLQRILGSELPSSIDLYEPYVGIASNSTGFSANSISVSFNYSQYSYDNPNALLVIKCGSWNYTSRACLSGWTALSSSIDKTARIVTGNSTGFSAYFLAENMCGNGLCEGNYGETTDTCSADCKSTTVTVNEAGGKSGGGGSISSADLAKIEQMIKSYQNVGGVKVETTSIYKEMFAGDTSTFRVSLTNTLNSKNTISLSADGDVKDFLFFDNSNVELQPNEARDVLIKIVAPKLIDPGNYDGDLVLASEGSNATGKIPVTVKILAPEGKLLDVKIQPLTQSVAPGGTLRLQTDLLNLGQTKKVDVEFDLQLLDVNTGEVVTRQEEAFAVETSTSVIKELKIPATTPVGKYMIKAVAYYSNTEDTNMQASSIAYINVEYPFFSRKLFGIPFYAYALFILAALILAGIFAYGKYLVYRRKRFKVSVDLNKLPQASSSSIFAGKIAETGIRAFIDLNKLQMHTLVAGATGSGKTVAAQDIVEGALLDKKSVIVFDPTAQWTGFLRRCEDKGMLRRYKYFDMKEKDAKSFNGSIKTIKDPYEIINIKDYMNREGELTIINISNLTPKEIDIIVASTIEQIFKLQPEESKDLKTLIVYDEVHRLLPKFGGSGQGFIQLERGAREFRKWGIGLLLISQVLSDFVGEVKANIGTEIQMGTRYEGDLERVSMKYGEDVLKSVVKEPIGTGMMVNAEYNLGKPYFVSFRPILHSTRRLSSEELGKYEKYFSETEDLDYQIARLKAYGKDVLDLELEMKLARVKVKEGQFQMADMYLESIRPRIEDLWKKIKKKPEHIVVKIMRREIIEAGVSAAKAEREKYIKKNPQKQLSADEEILSLNRKLEELKKKGKETSNIELKLDELKEKLKGFGGKLNDADSEGIKREVEALRLEIEKIK